MSEEHRIPHDKWLEHQVLGYLIAAHENFGHVADWPSEVFFGPRSKWLFSIMKKLHRKGQPWTRTTLFSQMVELQPKTQLWTVWYNSSTVAQYFSPRLFLLDAHALLQVYVARSILTKGIDLKRQWTPGMRPEEFINPTRATLDRLEAMIEGGQSQKIADIAAIVKTRLEAGDQPRPWRTDMPTLDTECGGLHPSMLYVFGACTHVGKTAFAITLTNTVALAGGESLAFTLETTKEEFTYRSAAYNTPGVDAADIRQARMKPEDFAKCFETVPQNIEVIDKMVDTDQLTAMATEWKQRTKTPGIVAIDYLEKVRVKNKFLSGEQRVAKISDTCQRLAKELRVPVVLFSQLKREAQGREPKMSDLRYSGQVENDAAFIGLLWQEEKQPKDDRRLYGCIKVVKNRITGKLERITYQLNKPRSQITEIDEQQRKMIESGAQMGHKEKPEPKRFEDARVDLFD